MPGIEYNLSEYKSVWLFTLFDLPVDTKRARRDYTRFRNLLLDQGFTQMQYSVYARFCASEEIAETYRLRIASSVPPDGYVRLIAITDRQFGKMQCIRAVLPRELQRRSTRHSSIWKNRPLDSRSVSTRKSSDFRFDSNVETLRLSSGRDFLVKSGSRPFIPPAPKTPFSARQK